MASSDPFAALAGASSTRVQARDGWVESDGLQLRYVEWGRPDAPAIVALHGLRSFAYTWESLAQRLADRFRIIALDQRGRGMSDWDPGRRYYTASYVHDLETLVDELRLQNFVLLGHSMGGAVAFVYSTLHADRLAGLVIEDIGPGSSADSAGADRIKRELRETPNRFASWFEAAAFWRRQRPDVSEEALQARVRHSMKATDDGAIVWRHDAQGIADARLNATPEQLVALWPHAERVSRPMLVLRGARSDFLSAEVAVEMCRRNPNIRYEEIPAAGHYVHDDNFAAFDAALQRFLGSAPLAAWAGGMANA
ncbi:MAG TPA: alpha/beta hydrolase [Burkholderiaceae bacterium]